MDTVIETNFKYPSYFHASSFLYYYRKKEYSKALLESDKLSLPEIFWSPMLRIAVLGQLNRIEEAGQSIEILKQLKPNFEEKAAYLISRFVKKMNWWSMCWEE